ncbi:MAG: RNA polymerase sigma factor [Saprospiraceae bacterium]
MPGSEPGATGLVDHLFRQQYGKYIAILTRIFGFEHIETIEDALQDTFANATLAWRDELPDNPEAWLTTAAKNRTLDLFRKIEATRKRELRQPEQEFLEATEDFFLDEQIADAQLRMIFAACHPGIAPPDQLAFALRTISGFSQQEVASALLVKVETMKKRLLRARKGIQASGLAFEIPQGLELEKRLAQVLNVLYLIFNEGFHSGRRDILIRKDLCGEAMRLCALLLRHPITKKPAVHALFALMCFQAARLETKVNAEDEILDLRRQDRSKWHKPLVDLGNQNMMLATDGSTMTKYHYEAAIAAEHVAAKSFEATDWAALSYWYACLQKVAPSNLNLLSMSVIEMQADNGASAKTLLAQVDPKLLGPRRYLYHGCHAEWHRRFGNVETAKLELETALGLVTNSHERAYMEKKLAELEAE